MNVAGFLWSFYFASWTYAASKLVKKMREGNAS
jgi:hypothetical protein